MRNRRCHIDETRGQAQASTIGEVNLDGTGLNQSFITGAAGPIAVALSPQ